MIFSAFRSIFSCLFTCLKIVIDFCNLKSDGHRFETWENLIFLYENFGTYVVYLICWVAWIADFLVDLLKLKFSISAANFDLGVWGGVSWVVFRLSAAVRFFGVFFDGVSTANFDSSSRARAFEGVSSILLKIYFEINK